MTDNPSATGDVVTRIELESALIQQDHRIAHVVYNLWKTRSLPASDPRRSAATQAIVWRLFAGTAPAAGIGAGFVGFIGLVIGFNANSLLSEQNRQLSQQSVLMTQQTTSLAAQTDKLESQNSLLKSQNQSIETQSELSEASRRTGLLNELSILLERIEKEIESRTATVDDECHPPQMVRLSPRLSARVATLSMALKPYRYRTYVSRASAFPFVDQEGHTGYALIYPQFSSQATDLLKEFQAMEDSRSINVEPLSPERAYLLLALSMLNIDIRHLSKVGAVFDCADFRFMTLRNLRIHGAKINGASFLFASIEDCDLSGCSLYYTDCRGTLIRNCRLDHAHIHFTKSRETRTGEISLVGALFDADEFRSTTSLGSLYVDNAGRDSFTGRKGYRSPAEPRRLWQVRPDGSGSDPGAPHPAAAHNEVGSVVENGVVAIPIDGRALSLPVETYVARARPLGEEWEPAPAPAR